MVGRPPVILSNNKHNFTKAEREAREKAEDALKTGTDEIKPPSWLDTVAKKEFRRLAKNLIETEIIYNTDVGGLAIACDAYSKYIMATAAINETTINTEMMKTEGGTKARRSPLNAVEKYAGIYLKYCAQYGLTPASRLKLAINKTVRDEPINDMAEFIKRRVTG